MSAVLAPDVIERLTSVVDVRYALQPAQPPINSLELLSDDELARWERYRFPRDRDRFLWSRLLLRTTLSEYFDVAPQDWRFTTTTHGKPEVSQPAAARDLRFNLSHTAGIAILAVAWQRDIGVDVEHRSREVTPRLVEFALSPAEQAHWETAAAERRAELFLSYWTLKEAYLKARGVGLSVPLRSFAFHVPDDDAPATLASSEYAPSFTAGTRWQFFRTRLASQYHLAVATSSSSGNPARLDVRPSGLR